MHSIAFNSLSDGRCLQDIELRRNDELFLDGLGPTAFPTTTGNFCCRFSTGHLQILHEAIDEACRTVWARQPEMFFDRATLNFNGTLGRCQQENLIEQLHNGYRALRAGLDILEGNGVCMTMTALAWKLKA